MTETEVLRLVAELIGLLVFVAGGAWATARQVWRVLTEVEQIRVHLTTMNGSVTKHMAVDEVRFGDISNRLSNIEGRLGLPPSHKGEP